MVGAGSACRSTASMASTMVGMVSRSASLIAASLDSLMTTTDFLED
jgi:hypothetical protein